MGAIRATISMGIACATAYSITCLETEHRLMSDAKQLALLVGW